MKKTFTRGPWFKSSTASGKGKVVDAHGFSICNMTSGTLEQQQIDASIVAHVPEMHAELTDLYCFLVQNGHTDRAEKTSQLLDKITCK